MESRNITYTRRGQESDDHHYFVIEAAAPTIAVPDYRQVGFGISINGVQLMLPFPRGLAMSFEKTEHVVALGSTART